MSSLRIACIQNHTAEGPARIRDWAEARGHTMRRYLALAENDFAIDEFDAFVVMGGPASANDGADDPNIARALDWVGRILETGKPVLGICLGAQMMAKALGGSVRPGPHKEIGWFPVQVVPGGDHSLADLADGTTVFHWHGEQIEAPPGARVLASTDACPVQAFEVEGRCLGLQFHLEVDAVSVEDMVTVFEDEVAAGGEGIQTVEEILVGVSIHGPGCVEALGRILDRWIVSGEA